MKQIYLKFSMLLLCLVVGLSAWGETKTGSWDLTSSSSDWTTSGNETYFSQPYGYKKANGTLTNKSIPDFSTNGITQIKVGFKCLQNSGTTSKLTIYLVDKDGKTLGNGVVVTPDNISAASQTTYKYATFTTNLTGATGFMMKVTTFGKNILINGAEYEVIYTPSGETPSTPTIAFKNASLDFGIVKQNEHVQSKTISATISNVSAATVSLSGDGASAFSIDKTTLTESGDIIVTPNTSKAGTFNATLTLSAEGATSVTKDIKMEVEAPFDGTIVTMSAGNDADIKFVTGSSSTTGAFWANSTPLSSKGITLSGSNGSSSSYSYYDGSVVRFYQNNSFSITPENGITITKVEIARQSTTGSNTGTINCSGLEASKDNTTTNTNVYTGDATSTVTFTASAQTRFTSIAVYYTGSLALPQITPTISANYETELKKGGASNTYTVEYDGDGSLTVESSETKVATVSIFGNMVTVNPISSGTTVITISSSETNTYYGASLKYTLSVLDPNATQVTFDFTNPSLLQISEPGNSSGMDIETPIVLFPITLSTTNGSTNTRIWNSNGVYDFRIYKNAAATFTAEKGYVIKNIEIKGDNVADITTNPNNKWELFSSKNGLWTGESESVTITIGETTNNKWNTVIVTFGAKDITPDPDDPSDEQEVKYVLVEQQEDLVDGEYVIAVNDNGIYKAMTSNISEGYLEATTVSVANRTIKTLNGAAVWTVVVDTDANDYSIASICNNNNYLCCNNSTLEYTSSSYSFFAFVSDGGEANVYTNDWNHWFGYADGFMMSANDENAPSLYFFKKTELAPTFTPQTLAFKAQDDDELYYATYSSDKVSFFPKEVAVVNYVSVDSEGKLSIVDLDESDAVIVSDEDIYDGYFVPANEGVLIYSEDPNITYYSVENMSIDKINDPDFNMLKPASETMSGDYKFYKLAYGDYTAKTALGFYYGAENGGAFNCKTGTAYLAVPSTTTPTKSFVFGESATSIKSISNVLDVNAPIYNIAGQRVDASVKGILIQNGKKFFNK